ncbi:sugar phosphate isomerase/epimerase family protein [Halobacillus sp. B23F22_1]|uniref:sugar phosphate isomerase/epimerase family protein n=1 Tax=Halobacillus sp. B23F22_1 TaxID=3459514 RepID=UPI00373EC560
MAIDFGCQGSTWVLDYDVEADMMDQVMEDVKNGGLKGVDVQISLLGKYKEAPERLKEELDKKGLQLAALTIPHAFVDGKPSQKEKELEDYYFEYLKHFPGAIMNVPSRVESSRDNLLQRQKEIIKGANELGKRALEEHGITTSIHPISYKTSYWRFKEDYEVLFEGLDPRYMGYTPDAGHILFGDMNPVEIFKEALPLIKHVHYKDASKNNEWMKIGQGDIDFVQCTEVLKKNDYDGWIILEEETGAEQSNTSQVIAELGDYVQNNLKSIVK